MPKRFRDQANETLRDPRWTAVLTRDPTADGQFVYSVRTTGIYCRPACGARTPRPKNVTFHATPAEAERAGFRPCKRCKPDQPSPAARHADLIAALCRGIESGELAPKLAELASHAQMSTSHLQRSFKTVTGLTPKTYAKALRAKRVRDGLGQSATVTAAIYEAGYGSSSRFYENADRLLGMTPKQARNGGADAVIHFAVGECSLGAVLVAASPRGICAISLGDDPDRLARDLQDRFPKAEFVGADPEFERLIARVVGFIEMPKLGLDLPLDVRGTAFQLRVWEALRDIPAGTTVTYGDLARRLGSPKAARAVAHACAANPAAIAIPCHRVVRKDGVISGYRWGIERKRALLEREAKDREPVQEEKTKQRRRR